MEESTCWGRAVRGSGGLWRGEGKEIKKTHSHAHTRLFTLQHPNLGHNVSAGEEVLPRTPGAPVGKTIVMMVVEVCWVAALNLSIFF